MSERIINAERIEQIINVFGSFDENIKLIEHELDVSVVSRDDQLKISGEEDEAVDQAAKVIQGLLSLSARGETIHEQNVRYLIQLVKSGNEDKIQTLAADVLCVTAKGKPVKAKTVGQKRYVDAIRNNTITLGVGPAGTGKTYLAVAAAVAAPDELELMRLTGRLERDKELADGVLASAALIFRDALVCRCGGGTRISTSPETAQRLAAALTRAQLMRLAAVVEELQQARLRNVNYTLFLTLFCARLRAAAGK